MLAVILWIFFLALKCQISSLIILKDFVVSVHLTGK